MAGSKHKRAKTNPEPQDLRNYILPMILSAAVGAGITFLIMSQRASSESRSPAPATATAPSAPLPNVTGLSTGEAAVLRGNQAYDHQQWNQAIREYQNAIASGTDNADVRTDLGNAFRFSGDPGKALEQYKIAQRMDPQHENSLFNQIGLFNEVLHDHAGAVPLCEEFMRRFPTSDKLPAVQQQLARAKNPAGNPATESDETGKTLSKWLGEQPKTKP